MTRWDGLFADLEARAEALDNAERAGEVDERARIELGTLALRHRLRPAVGSLLRLRCIGGLVVSGELTRVGAGWLLVAEDHGREWVVLQSAVLAVTGLSRLAAPPDTASLIESRLGLGHVLRGLARDRSAVGIRLRDGTTLSGTLDRVGQDFVEFAVHAAGEPRRRAAVRQVQVLPYAGLAALQRDG